VFRIAFAPDVHTAHRNPTTPGDLLRDAYRRGRRRANVAWRLGRERPGVSIAASTLRSAPWGFVRAWRSGSRRERAVLIPALLLLPMAALAYATGAVSHDVSPGSLVRSGRSGG
jgi:hypothetical protein